ncbi:unnamed protein product [Caenorhabditis nigoni]
MKELIKSSQAARFKNVASIVYECDGTDPPLVYIDYGVYNSLLKFSEYDENENVQFQLNVSGKVIDFRLSDHHYCPVALFHPREKESVIESIHNHFLDLFGTSMEYHWKTNNMLSTPQLQNLSICIRMRTRREFENRTDVDNFFSSHPVLKSIEIRENELLSPESESRLLQAESLQIIRSDRTLLAVLRNFQGKQACLHSVSIKVSDVVEFVNRWKSGVALQNLEHLKITTLREEIPRDETLAAIGARHIDATKKPPAHIIPKAYIEYAYKPNTDPIISHSYVLSLVSKKIRKLVKSSQRNRLKNTISIVYDCCYPLGRPFVHIRYKENSKILSSKLFDFIPYGDRSIIESIHNNFLYLFSNSAENHWITDNYKLPFPRLENLSMCFRINIRDTFGDLKNFDNFISSHPVMKSIDLGFWADESLSPESESKLYQVEYIKINQLNRTNPAILRHFQGKQAFLDCYVLETSDLIDFVNRWKSGEAYHKLEYLTIRKYREEIPRDEILTAIGPRHIDATRKPPAHSVPRAFIEYVFEPHTDPITSHSYVVRESDNRVASVLIQGKTLSFGVWDKTEEEFLRMVDCSQIDS